MLSSYDENWCQKLLNELNKMPITAPFLIPVNHARDNAPEYFDKIKNPMDFGTMKKKLDAKEYHSVAEFIDDIKLICDNAKEYNGVDSMYGLICDDIMVEVQKQYCEKADSEDQEWFRALNKAISELQEHMKNAPANVSMSFKETPMPDLSKISDEQAEKIRVEIGGDQISNLEKRWMFLSDNARKNIIKYANE